MAVVNFDPDRTAWLCWLDKKLVLVGRTQRLEIWSEANWNAEREKSQANYRACYWTRRYV